MKWLKPVVSALLLCAAFGSQAAPDLSKVTLVLGGQARNLRSLIEAADVMKDAPYHYRWANFQGAAPLFEAQRAGAVDTSYAGDLPVLMAASGGVPLKIIATNVGDAGSNGLIVPADSPIHSVKDLAGKQVVVSSARGSISQHLLYEALEEAKVPRDTVPVRFVLPTDASAAFNSGQITAWATFDPYLGIAEKHGARLLRDGKGLTTALSFVTATQSSLDDPAKRAAIADFTHRLAKAREWALAHPQQYNEVYAQLTRLQPADAQQITARISHGVRGVTPDDVAKVQKVSDLFSELNILPNKVDVQAITDNSVFQTQ
ncbi:ABC transporter substrate-binding protein [Pantoea sp. SORGH_AS_0659]|uniref:ABC transporter substrate-binding protein n=1 Tax=Pantoea sp. SORGH_AS_0659 TaxID=3062597 RepID=UPI00285FB24F|nr:ABC transporter substrate-binding protein [Pantoea sp. SORGH_AS_0659]MDR6348698.1 sulfonate transport system substrate-binding protein [Pantoea sp. SORGH_AS_0659]